MKKLTTIALTIALLGAVANATPITDPTGNDDGAFLVTVDLVTGAVTLTNTTAAPITFNGLNIMSSAGILDPVRDEIAGTGWKSVADYLAVGDFLSVSVGLGAGAFGLGELQATANTLTEANPGAAATLQPGATWSIGNPIIPGSTITPGDDFTIQFNPVGGSPTTMRDYDISGGQAVVDPESDLFRDQGAGNHGNHESNAYDFSLGGNANVGPLAAIQLAAAFVPGDEVPTPENIIWYISGNGMAAEEVLATGSLDPIITFAELAALGATKRDGSSYDIRLAIDGTPDSGGTLALPEPTTMGLMLFGAIGVIARKRRRS